jgi:hypothetical protein
MEWLLAVATHDCAADVTAGISRGRINALQDRHGRAELVVLVANLMGGV